MPIPAIPSLSTQLPAESGAAAQDRIIGLFENEAAAEIRFICDLSHRPAITAAAAAMSKQFKITLADARCAVIIGILSARPEAAF